MCLEKSVCGLGEPPLKLLFTQHNDIQSPAPENHENFTASSRRRDISNPRPTAIKHVHLRLLQ